MADIEVKIYWQGRLIKTVTRPERIIDGVTVVRYKKKFFALKPGLRIDIDKPPLGGASRRSDDEVISDANKNTPLSKTAAAVKRSEKPIEWDAEQRAVIDLETTARVLVSAGPGMGKTAVACARVAKLVADGVEPANIWLISFTRTAVREIRNRIAALVKEEGRASSVRITTLDSHAWHLAQGFDGESAKKIFRGYDETIESVLTLLEESSEALDEYLESMEHLIVDEAQDLVGLRADLVFALMERLPASCGVTVFADDAQAIYGWSAEDTKTGELRNADDNLSKRLRVSRLVPFRTMELRKVYRTDSSGLKTIFESTRQKVLRPSTNAATKVLEIRTDIEKFADGGIGQVLQQGIEGRTEVLLLFRRRGEVLLASSFLLGKGIAHRVRMSGAPVCVAPWVAITLREFTDRYLTHEQFAELWAKRMDDAGGHHPDQEDAWSHLRVAAGDRGGRIEMRRLRAKLGTSSPPLVFCNPELGTSGPIVGTIHASKGREADDVHLMLPNDSGNHETDEESRVLFVGATRARNSLHIGKGYQYSGTSLDGSGRAYRPPAKGKGTWAHVEIGRAGDLDELSCVAANSPFGPSAISSAQTLLSRFGGAIAPAKVLCVQEGSGTYRWHLMVKQGEEDIYLGLLANRVVADLFEVGKRVRAWQSWRAQLKPASQIEHMYIVGVRSVVLPSDHPHLESLEKPYSESGIFLCPIVYGFPPVRYESYQR
jgi:hypothetical protein